MLQSKAGYSISKLFLKVFYEGVRNIKSPPDIYGEAVQTPLPGGGGELPEIIIGDQDIDKIIFTSSYRISQNISVNGDIFYLFSGKNTISGTTYSIGLILEGQK